MNEKLKQKVKESLSAIVPITAIVIAICLFITPVSSNLLGVFSIGAVLLTIGIGLFSLGADSSMTLIGERIGASLSKSKKVWVIALVAFIVGTITTIAEPDLQVLATQITDVPNALLIGTVGIGVGVFLAIAMLRIVFNIKLSRLLIVLYLIVFALSFFVPSSFLPLAFDGGGVTTGPITVPFIIALGIGAASIRSSKDSENDNFGLVALCSVGPIIAVMILGIIFKIDSGVYTPITVTTIHNSKELADVFINALPQYALEVLKSILPIIVFFFLYNIFVLKLSSKEIKKIIVGFIYTYVGMTIFLTGVNIGFLPVGNELGMRLMDIPNKTFILPIMMLIGFFIVSAEPAVKVLTKNVSTITDGMISEKLMRATLSIGMMVALVISFIRAMYGIPIYYILIPGYLIALILTFFSPDIFTGIAFDSGGVISGPLTASFLLPLVIGICEASGRSNINVMKDAFGIVSMVALIPLIAIQLVGIMYKYRRENYFGVPETKVVETDDIIIFPKKSSTKSEV